MKFLCLECDAQMKTMDTQRQRADGTMAIVLECPECFGQFGLLTNPMETRLLDSLDVSVCPVGGKGRPAAAEGAPAGEHELPWTADAEERLALLPSFVRPMVRRGVADFARQNGHASVTVQVMADARASLGL